MSNYQENVGPRNALTPENAALLLIDHQVGLMQIVRDMMPEEFKNNVVGLAKTAKNFNIPVILHWSSVKASFISPVAFLNHIF